MATTGVKRWRINKLRDHRAVRMATQLVRMHPGLAGAPILLVRRLAQVHNLCDEFHAVIEKVGIVDERGEPRNAVNTYRQLVVTESRLASIVFGIGDNPHHRAAKTEQDWLDEITVAQPANNEDPTK